MPWGTYLWPGLPQLAKEGSWAALALAVGFAALVNAALCGTLVWDELAAPGVRTGLWVAVGLVWIASILAAWRWDRRRTAWQSSGSARDALAAAQDHYLKGNWFEAERILAGLIAENPRDVDAGLMRATLLRHSRRYVEAAGELERISRFESARKWELEIQREYELLSQAARSGQDEASQPSEPSGQPAPEERAGPAEPISDAA